MKNNARRKVYTHDKLKILIRETLDKFINEVYDNPIKTEYEKIFDNYEFGYFIDIYRFVTNSGNSYDLDFLKDTINTNRVLILNNNEKLSSIIKDEYGENINYIELGFTPTEIKDITIDIDPDIIGTEDDPYILRTNRNEQYELLNRISFLILEYVKNNPAILIYSIGKNTHENNLNSYIYVFNKIFSNKFKMVDVKNPHFEYGSFYFINKNILKNENNNI
jgi:hypothetical protein